jgi:ketosteroid isomerase-like protein
MSQQDVETLTRGYEAFAAGDAKAVLALLQDDFLLEVHTERPDMGSAVYHGREGFLANFAELTDVFDELKVDPTEIIERDENYLVVTQITGKGRGSGVSIEARIFHVWTIRDGSAEKLRIYNDRSQAEAALET